MGLFDMFGDLSQFQEMGENLVNFMTETKSQLNRIEANQRQILMALNQPVPVAEDAQNG